MAKIYTLSPSAAHRWCACPGSEHIIRQLPKLPTTSAAEEGTLAHEFAAWMLACTMRDMTGEEPVNGMPKEPEHALATEEILNAAQTYADSVFVEICKVFGNFDPKKVTYDLESPCSLSMPDISICGRIDFSAFFKDRALIVADFKFGGFPVPVKDNPQLLSYAVCLADLCIRQLGALPPRIIIGIVQPRSEISDFGECGAAMWCEYTREEFLGKSRELKSHAAKACAADDTTERAPGAHCKYCAARSVCRAAIGEKLLLADIAAGEAQMREDATDEQIGAWLTALKDMDAVRDDLVRIAKARIEKGETIPGWRTQGRRTRIWAQAIREADGGVDGQAAALAERLGLAKDDLVTKSLKTPAQVAKTLPKDALADVTEETTTTALVSTGGK